MTLRLRPESAEGLQAGARTVRRDRFIRSDQYERLRQELQRHLDGEILGRSFLIAGHRGAGKTALVQAVIDTIRHDLFFRAENFQSPPLRRPVLVKLHGPSLLAPTLLAPTLLAPTLLTPTPVGDAAEKPIATSIARTPRAGVTVNVAVSPTQAAKGDDTPVTDVIQSALVQITIALYRAVSAEFGESYRSAVERSIAARPSLSRDGAATLRERAAQLVLELDSGPAPGLLRAYWTALDGTAADLHRHLDAGVLWPSRFQNAEPDRGLREIVALATAAQAFRKCTGVTTITEKATASLDRAAAVSVAAGADLGKLADRLFASLLGIGVAAVVGVTKPTEAAAAGVASAVLGSLALNWSASSSRRDQRSTEYAFLPDLSVQSLDRDLPVMIDRLRGVGLLPVFVIDEIDKLDSPDDPIIDLMRRLKQLTSDYGFFCFLTDRDYYDRVQSRIGAGVFPLEHTFFTHRMLVAHQAAQFAAYLRGEGVQKARIETDLPATSDGFGGEAFAALVLGRVLLHRSALNPTDLVRGLSKIAGPGGTVQQSADHILSSPIYQLEAMLQLAIEHALRQTAIAARVGNDPGFAQIAADALYMISLAWRAKDDGVLISKDTLSAHLRKRMQLDAGGRRGLPLDQFVSERELSDLIDAVRLVAKLMCSVEDLRLEVEPVLGLEDRPLADLFHTWLPPLLKVAGKGFKFRWTIDGMLDPSDQRIYKGIEKVIERAAPLLQALRARLEVFDGSGIGLDDVVAAGLLPPTLSDVVIRPVILRVEDAIRASRLGKLSADVAGTLSADLSLLDGVHTALKEHEPIICLLVRAVRIIRAETGCDPAPARLAVQRHFPLPKLSKLTLTELGNWVDTNSEIDFTVPADKPVPQSTEPWDATIHPPDAWLRWSDRIRDFLAGTRAETPVANADLFLAATDTFPGNLFRYNPADMTAEEWSELLLAGTPGGDSAAPGWIVIAGLRALGCGQSHLTAIAAALRDRNGAALDETWDDIIKAASAGGPVLLMIIADDAPSSGIQPHPAPVMIRLRSHQLDRYNEALAWLHRVIPFEDVINGP